MPNQPSGSCQLLFIIVHIFGKSRPWRDQAEKELLLSHGSSSFRLAVVTHHTAK
jgi:hypothetical protein